MCVGSVIVKRPVLPPCVVDGRSRILFIIIIIIASPLYALTGKAPFVWTEEHFKSFQALKTALLSAEVLAMPQREGVFILDTGASDVAVGG